MRLLLFTSLFISFSAIAQNTPEFVQKVYDNMFNTMSDGTVNKPKLVYTKDEREVATYRPQMGELTLSERFVNIARRFGADSSNVIAHVVGHELAHILIQQNNSVKSIGTGYASEDISKQLKKVHEVLIDSVYERQADEYTCFFAHVAGYKTTHIAGQVLDSIYTEFGLKDKKLKRYPPLDERKEIASVAARQMDLMNDMFETAIISTVSGNYDMAIGLYETIILNKYTGKEIFNNLGTAYLLKALQHVDTLKYPYLFPVQIDVNTNLESTRAGFVDVDHLLNEAKRNFNNALNRNDKYQVALLNLSITEFLLGNDEEFDNSLYGLSKIDEIKVQTDLLKAIQLHYKGNKKEAKDAFKSLLDDPTAAKNYSKLYDVKDRKQEKRTSRLRLAFSEITKPNVQGEFLDQEAKRADTLRFCLKGGERFMKRVVQLENNTSYWWKNYDLQSQLKYHEMNDITVFEVLMTESQSSDYYIVFRSSNREYRMLNDKLLILENGRLSRLLIIE